MTYEELLEVEHALSNAIREIVKLTVYAKATVATQISFDSDELSQLANNLRTARALINTARTEGEPPFGWTSTELPL